MASHKERMLNAYKGIFSDFYPVSPEFWCYYPAKVLGVNMVELQREIPHWKAMRETFLKYDADGWCTASPNAENSMISGEGEFKRISDTRYRSKSVTRYGGVALESSAIFDVFEPCWSESYPVKNEGDLEAYMNAQLYGETTYDFTPANEAFRGCGEDILVEFHIGVDFYDFVCGAMGFEDSIMYFLSGNDAKLRGWLEKYTEGRLELLRKTAENTEFESVFIGCGLSCNSLLGPELWRKWSKPYLKTITDEAHKLGLMVHCHNHGKIMETIGDLAEIGFDCVCPFEREPGDVVGLSGLKEARRLLRDKVTFNGNVATVATLINGTPEDVRAEVREIKEAFAGSPRLIIGTGDQVGSETAEENIYAMIEEGRAK